MPFPRERRERDPVRRPPTSSASTATTADEFINRTVAQLLEKLRIEQTKSRPRRSNNNGLVETKNGAVIRKHIGYGYIDHGHAESLNGFYRNHLNPY